MPTYTVELTDDEVLALDYETARRNALPRPTPAGGQPLPPEDRAAVLAAYVREWLGRVQPHVQTTLEPLMAMIDSAPPAMRSALIMGVKQPYLRSYLTRKYGGMA